MKVQPVEAMRKLEESYKIFKGIQNQVGMAKALDYMGDSLVLLGRHEEALGKRKEAYEILRSYGDPWG